MIAQAQEDIQIALVFGHTLLLQRSEVQRQMTNGFSAILVLLKTSSGSEKAHIHTLVN